MFWKRVRKPSSIIKRLTWLYALFASSIFLVSSLILYFNLATNLQKIENQFLINEVRLIKNIMRSDPQDVTNLRQEILVKPTLIGKSKDHYFVRLLDENKNVILETKTIPPSLRGAFPDITYEDPHHSKTHSWKKGHQQFLLLSSWLKANDPHNRRLIQIALDVHQASNIIAEYQRTLLFVSLLGILISTFLGSVITRRGLAPLKNIAQMMQNTTISKLDKRLTPTDWPQELLPLTHNFNNLIEHLENSFNRLKQFSDDLAHELRNPINNLMGEAEICLTRERNATEYREVIESSLEEYARMNRLIEGLLFLAKVENPEANIQRSPIDIRQMAESLIDYYAVIAEENGIIITLQGEGILCAEPALIQRALNNLIANSIKYVLPHQGKIHLSIHSTENEIRITVSDNGIGVAEEHLPRLFDRFYRTDNARTQDSGGMGLGLAIVKSIMLLHKGQVSMASNLGQGTDVTLIFPLFRS